MWICSLELECGRGSLFVCFLLQYGYAAAHCLGGCVGGLGGQGSSAALRCRSPASRRGEMVFHDGLFLLQDCQFQQSLHPLRISFIQAANHTEYNVSCLGLEDAATLSSKSNCSPRHAS